jgi:hypothetical protein
MKTQGEIEAAICERTSRFEQDFVGRGPKHIHAHVLGESPQARDTRKKQAPRRCHMGSDRLFVMDDGQSKLRTKVRKTGEIARDFNFAPVGSAFSIQSSPRFVAIASTLGINGVRGWRARGISRRLNGTS